MALGLRFVLARPASGGVNDWVIKVTENGDAPVLAGLDDDVGPYEVLYGTGNTIQATVTDRKPALTGTAIPNAQYSQNDGVKSIAAATVAAAFSVTAPATIDAYALAEPVTGVSITAATGAITIDTATLPLGTNAIEVVASNSGGASDPATFEIALSGTATQPVMYSNFALNTNEGYFSATTDIGNGDYFAVINQVATAMSGPDVVAAGNSIEVPSGGRLTDAFIVPHELAPGTTDAYAHIVQRTGAGGYSTVERYGPFAVPIEGNTIGAGVRTTAGGGANMRFAAPWTVDPTAITFKLAMVKTQQTGAFADIVEWDAAGAVGRSGKNRIVAENSGGFRWNLSDGTEDSGNLSFSQAPSAGDLCIYVGTIASDGGTGSILNIWGYWNSGSPNGWRKVVTDRAVANVSPIDIANQTLDLIQGYPAVWFDIALGDGVADIDSTTVRNALVTGTNVLTADPTAFETAAGLAPMKIKMNGGVTRFRAGTNGGTGGNATVTNPGAMI